MKLLTEADVRTVLAQLGHLTLHRSVMPRLDQMMVNAASKLCPAACNTVIDAATLQRALQHNDRTYLGRLMFKEGTMAARSTAPNGGLAIDAVATAQRYNQLRMARLSMDAATVQCFAGILELLLSEVLDLSNQVASDLREGAISLLHLELAVETSDELRALLLASPPPFA